MAVPLFQTTATMMCMHGGQGTTIAASPRVLLGGLPAAVLTDLTTIVGCTHVLMPANKPQPCVRVTWTVGAARVLVSGKPALMQSSTGLCLSAENFPQGAPLIIATQPRVTGV
jgi:uncharacterized Zn-binding protein involved in type VI secretion